MDKYIELAKRWLEDPSSVTTEELRANADAAYAAAAPAAAWAYAAACAAADDAAEYTAICVREYEELLEQKGNE